MAAGQHRAVAFWQLRDEGLTRDEAQLALRGLPRAFRGVATVGKLDDHGWLMAATLACGRAAAISHQTALQLLGLRPWEPGPIHVSVPRGGGRATRDGLVIHRRLGFEAGACEGIPVTSPAQSLLDADLPPHELYRALEECDRRGFRPPLPLGAIGSLQQTVAGRTRSDAEARFIVLCHERGLKLPRVNHRLNGFETDFHWRDARLVVEVDGFEFHRDRVRYRKDRRRSTALGRAGWTVLRFSWEDVVASPNWVIDSVRQALGPCRRCAA